MSLPDLILAQSTLGSSPEEITVVMPVFNQSGIILRNLGALIESLSLNSRIIIIDDASSDSTSDVITSSIDYLCEKKPISIELYRYKHSRFETQCDAFGFSLSRTRHVLEVQADMQVRDAGFDQRLAGWMALHPSLIAISGRGVQPLSEPLNYFLTTAGSDRSRSKSVFTHILRTLTLRLIPAGIFQQLQRLKNGVFPTLKVSPIEPLAGDVIDFELTGRAGIDVAPDVTNGGSKSGTNYILIGETVMRGPLLIDREKYEEVGGFDTSAFFQGFDDHDLVLRGRVKGYQSGYHPVNFSSPEGDGTTRKPRSWKAEIAILSQLFRIAPMRRKSALALYAVGKLEVPSIENRVRHF